MSRSDESNVAVGIALPQYGTIASPKTILHVAVEAEKMGLASLWTSDRLLLPTKPKETFDGDPWPEIFATVYDPIEMLTFASASTRKVKLGTSVMSALFQNPVTLARRFATLDRLSGGRAIAGIGQGDFRDEFEAANIPMKRAWKRIRGISQSNARRLGPRPSQLQWRLLQHPRIKNRAETRTVRRHSNATGSLRSRINRTGSKNRRRNNARCGKKHHDREVKPNSQQLSRRSA